MRICRGIDESHGCGPKQQRESRHRAEAAKLALERIFAQPCNTYIILRLLKCIQHVKTNKYNFTRSWIDIFLPTSYVGQSLFWTGRIVSTPTRSPRQTIRLLVWRSSAKLAFGFRYPFLLLLSIYHLSLWRLSRFLGAEVLPNPMFRAAEQQ